MHKQIRFLLLITLLWIAASGLMANISTIQRNNDLAALSLTGEQYPVQGCICTYTITVRNTGTTFQSNYTVKLMQGNTELASAQGLPIDTLQTLQIPVVLNPLTSGETQIYGKVVLAGDTNPQNDFTNSLYLDILPMESFAFTVGEGNEEHYVPWNLCWHYSLQESLFYPAELNFIGMITQIAFYSNFGCDIPGSNVTLWMGTTTQSNLENGWIPSSQLTQVYNGILDMPLGPTPFIIELPIPFLYLGDNLVLLAKHGLDPIYYTQQLRFFSQTVGTNRARLFYSDTVNPDPTNPQSPGTLSGTFPKTTFMYINTPFTSLRGTVRTNGVPLPGVTVTIPDVQLSCTTNYIGQYRFTWIESGTYQVTASKTGYVSQTQTVFVPESQVTFLDFNLQPMPVVNVTGQVRGSDNISQGLPDAIITLDGDIDYTAVTDSIGEFSIPGVFVNTNYQYTISHGGFYPLTGTLNMTNSDMDMGLLTLAEMILPPRFVQSSLNASQTIANITWRVPNPDTTDVIDSFESPIFPPQGWTQTITCSEPPNQSGVLPTWCRCGTVDYQGTPVTPTEGEWQAGMWWTFTHQDEWLITPEFICPLGAELIFDTKAFYGSDNGDHYYVEVSTNNGDTWSHVWDASALTGGWNNYQNPATVNLAIYIDQAIKLAWHADDPSVSNDGMWYVWFIDNIRISSPSSTLRFSEDMLEYSSSKPSKSSITYSKISFNRDGNQCTFSTLSSRVIPTGTDRSLLGYKVWRLQQGQEDDFALWTLLTPNIISETSFADGDWNGHGTVKWAVKAVYSNDNVSTAAFSNAIVGVYANQDETAVPTALLGCYPNPFSERAVIKYQLSESCTVSLRIYNTKGQLVKILLNQPMKAGQAQTVWDRTDNHNNRVSEGIYYIRMQAGTYQSTRKVLLMQ